MGKLHFADLTAITAPFGLLSAVESDNGAIARAAIARLTEGATNG